MTDTDHEEHRLCGEFWVWLYERRRATGREPTDEEKMAHPAFVALKALRASQEAKP